MQVSTRKPRELLTGSSPESTRMLLWIAALALGSICLGIGFALSGWTVRHLWLVLGLALVAAVAERGRVRVSTHIEESISLVPTLFAAVLFGPLPSMIVAAASMLGHFGR